MMKAKMALMFLGILFFSPSLWSAEYECTVTETRYKGAHIFADPSRQEHACGSARFDTEERGKSSAFFDCGQGVAMAIHRMTLRDTDATYVRLSVLEPGRVVDWQKRSAITSTVVEAKNGIPADLTLTLSLDDSNLVRKQSLGYYALCRQLR